MTSVVKINSEFRVNADATGNQLRPEVSGLNNGNFVVFWQEGLGYQAQIFTAVGNAVGSEFALIRGASAILGLPDGGFVVFGDWSDSEGALGHGQKTYINAQVYDAVGAKIGDPFLVNTEAGLSQGWPSVTMLADGRYVVTWGEGVVPVKPGDGGIGPDITAQIFDANWAKVGGAFLVSNETKDYQFLPDITALAGGGFVVTWIDWSLSLGDNSLTGIAARVYDASGAAVGGSFRVNTTVAGYQDKASVAALAGGGFVVTWQDSAGGVIRAQLYDAVGSALGAELRVSTSSGQYTPEVTALANGYFVVSYTSGSSIKAQVFDASGSKIGGEVVVNTSTGQYIEGPNIAALTNGDFVITWFSGATVSTSDFDVKAQILSVVSNVAPVISSNGVGESTGVSIPENSVAVTTVTSSDADAGTMLHYTIAGGADAAFFRIDKNTGVLSFRRAPDYDFPSDAGANSVYNVVVQVSDGSLVDTQAIAVSVTDIVNERIIGTARADVLTGAGGNDMLKGGGGADRLDANGGNDVLDGGIGVDRMEGGAGDDIYHVESVGDQVIEATGAGSDKVISRISYTLAANVEKLLLTGTASISATGNDLGNVITGNTSGNAITGGARNDALYGRAGLDTLYGRGGNDVLDGGTGSDRMEGGAGNDRYVVDSNGDQVIETMAGGTDKVTTAISYVLPDNVEDLMLTGTANLVARGNDLANTITGNAGNNSIMGRFGRDVLNGGAGSDTLYGGDGNDVLTGGAGQDFFVFDTTPSAGTNVDKVRDFSFGDNDKIELAAGIFTGFNDIGVLVESEFHSAAGATAAKDSTDRVVYDSAKGRLYYDADGVGGIAAVLIAVIGSATHPALVYSDFTVI